MMRKNAGRTVMMSVGAAALLGCASGAVTGSVAQPGQPAAPLTMTWQSGLFGESGKISAVLPDGERLAGTYTVVTRGTSWSAIDPAWKGAVPGGAQGQIDDSMWGAAQNQETFVRGHLNKAVATLRSDRGTTMLCRFTLASGEAGMGGGGAGECQTSHGAKITAKF
jgi:hypothetical protein